MSEQLYRFMRPDEIVMPEGAEWLSSAIDWRPTVAGERRLHGPDRYRVPVSPPPGWVLMSERKPMAKDADNYGRVGVFNPDVGFKRRQIGSLSINYFTHWIGAPKSEPEHPNPLLSRLAAAEAELRELRREIEEGAE